MYRFFVPALASGLLSFGIPTTALAQTGPTSGWGTTTLINPIGSSLELSDGRLLTFDGQLVELLDATGSSSTPLFDFGQFVFGGAFVLAPDESYAVVGESSAGDVFRVELDGSGATLLTTLPFNFDAAFDPGGELYVSAAVNGFGTPNELLQVDPVLGGAVTVGVFDGPSGPIDFDAQGNLYYATQSPIFPAPAGSTDVLLFTSAQLAGGVVLGLTDGLGFGTGFDGGIDLEIDRSTGAVFLAEVNFGSGLNQIRRVVGGAGSSPVLYSGPLFESISLEGYFDLGGLQIFAPYQPAGAGRLVFSRTDFVSVDERAELAPERPNLDLSGPGATGIGTLTIDLDGLEPGQPCLMFFAPGGATADVVLPGALPLFVNLDLASAATFPFPFGADANGEASVPLFNPGVGSVTFQGLVYRIDMGATQLLGTTNAGSI